MKYLKAETNKKTLLFDALKENGIIIERQCGGNGICGKCKVKARGNLSPVCDAEKKYLSTEELKNGFRLACKTYVDGEFEAEVEESAVAEDTIKSDIIDKRVCMVADIGTTVLEVCFYSLPDFAQIKKVKLKNPQAAYGADVLSRVSFGNDEKNRSILKNLINDEINKACEGINIEYSIITGNTAMLHMYNGIDASPLASYPFNVPDYFGYWKDKEYFPPCISAYIGADSVTAILDSNMLEDEFPSMLIDIGTNGEIMLYDGEKIYCSSTAAGPALEGASIKMGMFAENGAIKCICPDGKYETVNNSSPKGICASGIIDAICYMLKKGELKQDGYLQSDFQIGDSGVCITPQDIRNIQLAKAAIRAGIDTLLSKSRIKPDELKNIYIAGALGNNVNIENCVEIGLFPKIKKEKIKLIGNAALSGGAKIAENFKLAEKTLLIIKKAEHVELAFSDEFMKRYIECMNF